MKKKKSANPISKIPQVREPVYKRRKEKKKN